MLSHSSRRIVPCFGTSLALILSVAGAAVAQQPQATTSRCDYSDVPGVVWWGTEPRMEIERFAAYAAPVYWFSPDEPLLSRAEGVDVRIPHPLPFEDDPDRPIIYYQIEEIVTAPGLDQTIDVPGFVLNTEDKGRSIIDLRTVTLVRLGLFAYFSSEVGLGAHPHDLEPAEMKIVVLRSDGEHMTERYGNRCAERNYVFGITRVTGKAHGLEWYWNISNVDVETRVPFTLLVEEGKHAIGTDKNGDGYFTPSYDVDVRVNDAWGTRDIMRSGGLFSGGYQTWMTKVREPQHRVVPPLPEDSPLLARVEQRENGDWTKTNAVYELRPLPPKELAGDDKGLYRRLDNNEVGDWPAVSEETQAKKFSEWVEAGTASKSLAISYRYDGASGVSFVFPFFVVKNLELGITGGYLMHRMYIKDQGFRDFGWQIMYAHSASRWIDSYFGAGYEKDVEDVPPDEATEPNQTVTNRFFVMETGLKFRVDIRVTPFKFLGVLTPFWGLRAGIKNVGFPDIDRLTYVLEFGAGAF
jgi:hypothetical protein